MYSSPRRQPLYPRTWGTGNVAYVGEFRAFSMAVLGRSSLEIGDKIILPPQALESINRLRLPFPLIFQVRKFTKLSSNILSQNQVINQYKRRIENIYRSTNPSKLNKIDKWLKKYKNNPHELYIKICTIYGILPKPAIICNQHRDKNIVKNDKNKQKQKSFGKQYCSVYEFSSPQSDSAYLPHWMMQNLSIDEGDKIEIESQFNIPKGQYCKLQPFKQEFMDKVSTIGYKSTLEHSLRHYSVLSINQRIVVEFNHFPYECIVKQTKPGHAISILGSTDLEIEFYESVESDINNNMDINNDMDTESISEKEDDSSSSLGLSDIDNIDIIVNKSEIDGALLKKLGVPLDYNEQTDLAMMIIENRKLIQENESRFDDKPKNHIINDEEEEDEEDEEEEDEEEEEEEEEKEKKDIIIGPNDVKCINCGKYVHSMSIQMHEVHCIREYIQCKICNECIKKQDDSEHFKLYHSEITCICNDILFGKILYDKHSLNECRLRLIKCSYCNKTNITAIDYKEHIINCGSQRIICNICSTSYDLKNKSVHDCGIICILCGDRIYDSKDKLLHLVTSCRERRAICNYCGVFRTCCDMEQHRKFCGSRSEKCEKCMQFVSLMNMEPHLQSNCQWFNNNQLSSKKIKKVDQESNNNNFSTKQLCPHCIDDIFFDEEEFHIHIAIKHTKLMHHTLTQTVLASFNNPDILKINNNNNNNKNNNKNNKNNKNKKQNKNKNKKKKRRKLSSDSIKNEERKKRGIIETRKRSQSDNSKKYELIENKIKWSCSLCTFENNNDKQNCIMCDTPKSN